MYLSIYISFFLSFFLSFIASVCCNITRCDLRIEGGTEAKLRSLLKWLNGFYKNYKIVQELSEKKNMVSKIILYLYRVVLTNYKFHNTHA